MDEKKIKDYLEDLLEMREVGESEYTISILTNNGNYCFYDLFNYGINDGCISFWGENIERKTLILRLELSCIEGVMAVEL